jgi:glutamate dehydrogenase
MKYSWYDDFKHRLIYEVGNNKAVKILKKYNSVFSNEYQGYYSVPQAISDLIILEKLDSNNPLQIDFYQIPQHKNQLHLKLYQLDKPLPLSVVIRILDNMGLSTESDFPYQLKIDTDSIAYINDFHVLLMEEEIQDVNKIKTEFEDLFKSIIAGLSENDGFNKLTLTAGLSSKEISLLRTYSKYMHQARFRFNQSHLETTLVFHAEITRTLIELFHCKFSLKKNGNRQTKIAQIENKIEQSLLQISNFDEDYIIRQYWALINATLRTNYFQTDKDGSDKPYMSIKLRSSQVPDLPAGKPLYELFIYSTRFEGIHLRNDKIARGGIRWSERLGDYRTEILGLMKAQVVKNSVIIPSGAKGGFVLKNLPDKASRQIVQHEVVSCYELFIRGLLDLTDNRINDKLISPPKTICYDDNDPYLVVAADKGTATFSDLANRIAKEYQFWLADAFASGGSVGYDHKKMGITARGAWESIKRHFLELHLDVHQNHFTVVGIGDMSGDVFGNGLLYSRKIKLIAAFDHRHIFLDPNPDVERSYDERLRLFQLPHSSWEDFNPKIISQGGGVYKRDIKSISLSREIKEALDIDRDSMTPNQLINAILTAPIDLLFNGGIGTYVKASSESNSDVGDKINEYCRVNGKDLRCKVVGEGGNLGFTQAARVEYALKGGRIFTDFIDNSAGVDCSDHEVNIKILLNKEVDKGDLTIKKRNQLLFSMTTDVAKLVLMDNFNQALVLSIAAHNSLQYSGLYFSYIKELERTGGLNRRSESIPDDDALNERKASGQALTRPEMAVILAYTKIFITNSLLNSDVPDDPYYFTAAQTAFPNKLVKKYGDALKDHKLRREIIATQVSNGIINRVGITFFYRLQLETGASIPDIARAYTVAAQIYETELLYKFIFSLGSQLTIEVQYEIFHHIRQLLNLASRWFLYNQRLSGDNHKLIQQYSKSIKQLQEFIPGLMAGITKEYMTNLENQFVNAGLDKKHAKRIAITRPMYTALNISEVAAQNQFNLLITAEMYFNVGARFNLVWFRDQILTDTREGYWNSLGRLNLREELDVLQRKLTIIILKWNPKEKNIQHLINSWLEHNQFIEQRWENLQAMLMSTPTVDYSMFFIALKELSVLLKPFDN